MLTLKLRSDLKKNPPQEDAGVSVLGSLESHNVEMLGLSEDPGIEAQSLGVGTGGQTSVSR